jgi:hypothetical protein
MFLKKLDYGLPSKANLMSLQLEGHDLLSVGDGFPEAYSSCNQVGRTLNNVSDLTNVISI